MKIKQLGFAGHLIVARDCRFHLTREVGNVLVSTVGAYDPAHDRGKRKGWETVGCDRLFETMVFKLGGPCKCKEKCGARKVADWSELDFEGYNTAEAAQQGHEKMVRKWARKAKQRKSRPPCPRSALLGPR